MPTQSIKQPPLQWNRMAEERIGEAESFWRSFWEEQGSGDENAEWLKEIEEAIRQRVPPASQEEWDLETVAIAKVISKKRNWSAPGPDRVVNFWWKHACAVHEDVKSALKAFLKACKPTRSGLHRVNPA